MEPREPGHRPLFYPSGEHEIEVRGPVIIRRFIGIWNMERYRDYQTELAGVFESVSGSFERWASICDFRLWELPAFEIFHEYYSDRIKRYHDVMGMGLTAECWIVEDGMVRKVLENHIDVPEDFDRGICTAGEEAAKWMADRGFPLEFT